MIEGNTPTSFTVGSIVTVRNPYHRRGASTGAIELITEQGWCQVWWEEDGDYQIHPAARTFEFSELKLCNNYPHNASH